MRRFFSTLSPVGPSKADTQWVVTQLSGPEIELWSQMWRPDRRHGAKVARRVQAALGDRATKAVIAAALLHDVGKIDSGLHTYGRVAATLSGMLVGRDSEVIEDWSRTRGFTRRVGLYLQHPRLGAVRLELAGSDPLTVSWAREHHKPADQWSIDPEIAGALADADDD